MKQSLCVRSGQVLSLYAALQVSACATTPIVPSNGTLPASSALQAEQNPTIASPDAGAVPPEISGGTTQPLILPTAAEVVTGVERYQAACDAYRSTGEFHDGLEGDRVINGLTAIFLAGGAVAIALRGMIAPKSEQWRYAISATMLLLVAQAAAISAHSPSPEEVKKICEDFPPLPLP